MQRIYFSRLGMPDNIEETGTVEFTIRWEVSYKEGERDQIDAHSYDEMHELLQHKVEAILKEKASDLARIVQSSVHHKTKYDPWVSEITGDYKAVLYRVTKS
ncbi:MAG: hypothetical protein ACOY5B_15885 [Spirochaetota bacterium]